MKKPDDESDQVWGAIEGTVVDWTAKTQIHPETGAVYDFKGNLLVPPIVAPPEPAKPARKTPKKGKS